MGEIPGQRSLVERFRDEPFAIVGVNTDDDRDEYRRKVAEYGVTWRSAWQGSTQGPIPTRWGIDAYPTIFVLDAQHVLRFVGVRGASLEQAVESLLAEARAARGR